MYGGVVVGRVQNLGDPFSCTIEVFLCTGAQVQPRQPGIQVSGWLTLPLVQIHCVVMVAWVFRSLIFTRTWKYNIKLSLGWSSMWDTSKSFWKHGFHATLAADCADAFPLVKQPGSDGFSLSSAPLFQVSCLVSMVQKRSSMVEDDWGGEQSVQVIIGSVLVSNRLLTSATHWPIYIPSHQNHRQHCSVTPSCLSAALLLLQTCTCDWETRPLV